MRWITIPSALIALVLTNIGIAQDLYASGYIIIASESAPNDDLSVTVMKRVRTDTVYLALEDLLEGTGWQLADQYAAEPRINRLYQQRLPEHKSNIGPMALDDALQWFAGKAWMLVVDPVNKLISYELKDQYQPKKIEVKPAPSVMTVSQPATVDKPTEILPASRHFSEPEIVSVKNKRATGYSFENFGKQK